MTKLGNTTSSVWPSPCARAASSYPITAPAPGRFSTITGCPRPFAICSPSRRLVTSAAPPGGKGTMMRTGFEGKDCAWTALASAAKERNSATVRRTFMLLQRPEEHFAHLVRSDLANDFTHGAIHQNQYDQKDLDGPEMRPHDFREQLLVSCDETAGFPPEVDEALQIVEQHGDQHVDRGLPGDVVRKRLVGIAIDERQQVRDQH